MRHITATRRTQRHHPMLHRPPKSRAAHFGQGGLGHGRGLGHEPARLSDLILALLGVAMLGGLALAAAASLGARALAF